MSEAPPVRHTDDSAAGQVLVIDDDVTVRDVVRRYLERAGYQVTLASDGEQALERLARERPDLVVLDLMLPGVDGIEVCRRLRRTSSTPVLMLTALGEEDDRIAGLEVGADDYVAKPFSPRELVLRVSSILRRAGAVADSGGGLPDRLRTDGDLVLDVAARTAHVGDVELTLTTREFDLLSFLIAHPGTAYTRTDLLEKVWGWDFGDHSTVTVHVRRLREKLEIAQQPRRIVTVWGVGYRYDPQGE